MARKRPDSAAFTDDFCHVNTLLAALIDQKISSNNKNRDVYATAFHEPSLGRRRHVFATQAGGRKRARTLSNCDGNVTAFAGLNEKGPDVRPALHAKI